MRSFACCDYLFRILAKFGEKDKILTHHLLKNLRQNGSGLDLGI